MILLPFLILALGGAFALFVLLAGDRQVEAPIIRVVKRAAELAPPWPSRLHEAEYRVRIGQIVRRTDETVKAFRAAGHSTAEANEAMRRFNATWRSLNPPSEQAGPKGQLP